MALSESRTTNQKKLTASNDAVEECSICYDPFTNKAFASDCLHNFCYQCIYTWVQLRATCPLCLHPITSIIKNVRSIDDYDIEQVAPPQIDVFADYLGDIDMPDDVSGYDYDSDIDDESMSMASDHEVEFYEDESSDDNEDVQSAPHSSQESLSQINIFEAFAFDDEYGTDEGEEEDEVSESPLSEHLVSSSEDEKDDDENGDNGENDENHSENEEFFEDNDDEDYDYDDNNNEDEYEDDDNNEDYANFTDTYDEDEDDDEDCDRLSLPRYSFSSECDSEERSQDQGYVLSKFSDYDDSDSDPDYTSSPFTASYVYSCDYY